ncbi:hypothetical protein [Psychroserpens sp. MEBiC05023]
MKTLFKLIVFCFFISFSSCEQEEVIVEDSLERSTKDEDGCETAFAYGKEDEATCFLDDDDLNSNRWGWTIGPITPNYDGSYEIYQAAGGCNLDNGELIGTLYVTYESDYVLVNFVANEGFGFFETHLYVGNEKYPTKRNGQFTVAPGQYPYNGSFPEGTLFDDYKIDDVEGEIYIIAHAVVCPFKKEDKD